MLSPINSSLRMIALLVIMLTMSAGPRSEEARDPNSVTSDSPAAWLNKADAIRFPRESFETQVEVINYRDGEVDETRAYRVLSRGNENTIVLTIEPAAERGQALLMRGRDLWIYMPSVSQPIRLSLSQRLTGQVANGDLARANFAGDYEANWLRNDELGGRTVRVLELSAAEKGVTYSKVHYWIDDVNHRPLRAEFFARSGRLLKTMQYEEFRELAGAMRPTRLVIDDALKPGRRSVLTYNSMTVRELPEAIFSRDYLRKLQ